MGRYYPYLQHLRDASNYQQTVVVAFDHHFRADCKPRVFYHHVTRVPTIIALKEFLEKFGKGIGFTIATIFFPFITFPMLAFGDDQFKNE